MTPLISIIIPTYNRACYFPQVVDSLLAQSCPQWEAVVVDDGSEPEERAIIERECGRDSRISFHLRTGNLRGAPVCRNQGYALSRGDFVIFLDADDALHPDCLSERLAMTRSYPQLDFSVSPCRLFREVPGDMPILHNAASDEDDLVRFLRADIPWQTSSPLWRRAALERMGLWDEALPSWQDWEFHIRALLTGLRYERFHGGVSYWRTPTKGSIGGASVTVSHFRPQEDALFGVAAKLGKQGAMTSERRHAIAGNLLRIAILWVECGQRSEAVRLWKRAAKHSLVDGVQFALCWVALWLHPIPAVGRVWRVAIRKIMPPYVYPVISRTAFLTPESHLEEARDRYLPVPDDKTSA